MKLIKYELYNQIMNDAYDKVLEHAPCSSPANEQIKRKFGWLAGDDLIRLKIDNPLWNIKGDVNGYLNGNLDETD